MASQKVDLTERRDFRDSEKSLFIPSKELKQRYFSNKAISNEEYDLMNKYSRIFGLHYYKSEQLEIFGIPREHMLTEMKCMYCGRVIRAPWDYIGGQCCRKCLPYQKNEKISAASRTEDAKRIFNLR